MRFVSIVDREGVEIEFVFGKDEAKKAVHWPRRWHARSPLGVGARELG